MEKKNRIIKKCKENMGHHLAATWFLIYFLFASNSLSIRYKIFSENQKASKKKKKKEWKKIECNHHHHVALVARISLTLSCHSSQSFIALDRSSGQHPVSSHSCWMYVRAGRPAFARPCVGVHKSTSLMSSSLLLQQCPACLVRLTWIVFVNAIFFPNYPC